MRVASYGRRCSVDDAITAVLWNKASRPQIVALGCSWIAHHRQFAGIFRHSSAATKPDLDRMSRMVTPAADSITLVGCSCSLRILEVHRTGVNPLKNSQHFRTRACCDQQTAPRTIGLDQLRVTRIDFQESEFRRRARDVRHQRTQIEGELMLLAQSTAHQAAAMPLTRCLRTLLAPIQQLLNLLQKLFRCA